MFIAIMITISYISSSPPITYLNSSPVMCIQVHKNIEFIFSRLLSDIYFI